MLMNFESCDGRTRTAGRMGLFHCQQKKDSVHEIRSYVNFYFKQVLFNHVLAD